VDAVIQWASSCTSGDAGATWDCTFPAGTLVVDIYGLRVVAAQ
jgi:hypothetical protein